MELFFKVLLNQIEMKTVDGDNCSSLLHLLVSHSLSTYATENNRSQIIGQLNLQLFNVKFHIRTENLRKRAAETVLQKVDKLSLFDTS